jgi:hypothetical protein
MRVATIAILVHIVLFREAIVISRYRFAVGLLAEISTTRPSGTVTDLRNPNGLPLHGFPATTTEWPGGSSPEETVH